MTNAVCITTKAESKYAKITAIKENGHNVAFIDEYDAGMDDGEGIGTTRLEVGDRWSKADLFQVINHLLYPIKIEINIEESTTAY